MIFLGLVEECHGSSLSLSCVGLALGCYWQCFCENQSVVGHLALLLRTIRGMDAMHTGGDGAANVDSLCTCGYWGDAQIQKISWSLAVASNSMSIGGVGKCTIAWVRVFMACTSLSALFYDYPVIAIMVECWPHLECWFCIKAAWWSLVGFNVDEGTFHWPKYLIMFHINWIIFHDNFVERKIWSHQPLYICIDNRLPAKKFKKLYCY